MKKLGTAARHRAFYVALAAAVVVGLATVAINAALAVVTAVNVFFVAYLVFTGTMMPRLDADYLKRHAEEEDAPALLILLVMAAAVAVSAASLFLVLMNKQAMPVEVGASIASVVLGWFAIHTMWAMHYAFEFYQPQRDDSGRKKRGAVAAGLEFPGNQPPDGTAFLYFSYVIGMTAQTSDTQISSNAMRRLVTVHSVFAFFFNTVIVAAAVNVVVTLAH